MNEQHCITHGHIPTDMSANSGNGGDSSALVVVAVVVVEVMIISCFFVCWLTKNK